MARAIALKEFVSERFLREIHHFLWLDGDRSRDVVDAGWSCRDHALLTALLMQSCGLQPMLAHGEAVFCRQTGNLPPVSVSQRPHSWLLLEHVGAVDLSVKPDFVSAGERYRLGLNAVFAGEWLPRGKGKVYIVEDADVFARALDALPEQRNHATALYHIAEAEHVHGGHITYSAGWIRSPLTQLIADDYGDPCALYAALLLHLRAFLARETPSLAGLTFDAAWQSIAATSDDALRTAGARVDAGFRGMALTLAAS